MVTLRTITSTIYSTWKSWNKTILISLLCLSAVHADTPETSFEVSNMALEFACKITGIDCVGLPAPHVHYSGWLDWYGLIGAFSYADPTGVMLSPQYLGGLKDVTAINLLALEVLIHETVHYVLYDKLYEDSGLTDEAWGCFTESVAWSAGNTFLVQQGLDKHTRYDWRRYYKGC